MKLYTDKQLKLIKEYHSLISKLNKEHINLVYDGQEMGAIIFYPTGIVNINNQKGYIADKDYTTNEYDFIPEDDNNLDYKKEKNINKDDLEYSFNITRLWEDSDLVFIPLKTNDNKHNIQSNRNELGTAYTTYLISFILYREKKLDTESLNEEWGRCYKIAQEFEKSSYNDPEQPFYECLERYMKKEILNK